MQETLQWYFRKSLISRSVIFPKVMPFFLTPCPHHTIFRRMNPIVFFYHFENSFLHRWILRLILCLGYRQWCCSQHWRADASSIGFCLIWLYKQQLLDHRTALFLILLRNLSTVLCNRGDNLHSCQQYVGIPPPSHHCQCVIFVFLIIAILNEATWRLILVLIFISTIMILS